MEKDDLAQLLDVFRAEAEEVFDKLSKLFVTLEEHPTQKNIINEVFRLVHSLKGSARMLGFASMEALAHAMEDVMGMARNGSIELATAHIDLLLAGLDRLQNHMKAISKDGSDEGVDDGELLTALDAVKEGRPPQLPGSSSEEKGEMVREAAEEKIESIKPPLKPKKGKPSGRKKGEEAAKSPKPAGEGKRAAKAAQPEEESEGVGKTETIRLPVAKLDRLMRTMEELLVVKIGAERQSDSLNDATLQMERWFQEFYDLLNHKGSMHQDELIEALNALSMTSEDNLNVLDALKRSWDDTLLRFGFVSQRFKEEISSARLLPFSTITAAFPRLVRDIAHHQEKMVRFVIEGEETEIDRSLLEKLKDPLVHLLRNAVDHGIESSDERKESAKPAKAVLKLTAKTDTSSVLISVEDDGRGFNYDRIRKDAVRKGFLSPEEAAEASDEELKKIVFLPGFSTASIITDISGRGVGMDVVQDLIRTMQGKLNVDSTPGEGTIVRLSFPLSLTTRTSVLVRVGNFTLALPCLLIEAIVTISSEDINEMKGEPTFIYDKFPLPLAPLKTMLSLGSTSLEEESKLSVVVVSSHSGSVGLVVDEVLGTQELVVKPVPSFLSRVNILEGCTVFADGTPSFILNVERIISESITRSFIRRKDKGATKRRRRLLVVEDSLTTQTMMKNLLLTSGFDVETAYNGVEALEKLNLTSVDLVITDVEMPQMGGFDLTRSIRDVKAYQNLPVILVTSLDSPEDKRRGIEVGANAYITKSSFDQDKLLDIIGRLL